MNDSGNVGQPCDGHVDTGRGLETSFDLTGLHRLRAAIAAHATQMGLSEERLASLLIVATELATNAIRHAGGSGWLRVFREDGQIVCQVGDDGPGIDEPGQAGLHPVPLTAQGGRGLWIVRRLSDHVTIDCEMPGTVVTVRFTL